MAFLSFRRSCAFPFLVLLSANSVAVAAPSVPKQIHSFVCQSEDFPNGLSSEFWEIPTAEHSIPLLSKKEQAAAEEVAQESKSIEGDEEDDEEDTEEEGASTNESGWGGWEPVLSMEFAASRKIVNLTRASDRSPKGYRVESAVSLGVNAGFENTFWFPQVSALPNGLFATIGITPTIGAAGWQSRFASTYQEARLLRPLELPLRARNFSTWSEGDSLAYATSGGVHFYGSIGMGELAITGNYSATGEWEVYVYKGSASQVEVYVTSKKLRELSGSVGGSFFQLEASRLREVSKVFAYSFDLSHSAGAKAYEDFIRGNLAPAQSLGTSLARAGIEPVSIERKHKLARSLKFKLGIPFLASFARSRVSVSELSEGYDLKNMEGSETSFQLKYSSTSLNLLGLGKQTTKGFYGASSRVAGKKQRYAAAIFRFESSRSGERDYQQQAEIVLRQTGVKIPDMRTLSRDASKGYLEMELRLALSPANLERMAIAAKLVGKDRFVKWGLNLFDQNFGRNYELRVCDDYLSQEEPSSEGAAMYSTRCRDLMWIASRRAYVNMYENLSRLVALRGRAISDAEWNLLAANVGRAMTENRFTLVPMLKLAGPGVIAEMRIAGEKIPQFCDRKTLN